MQETQLNGTLDAVQVQVGSLDKCDWAHMNVPCISDVIDTASKLTKT
jgi:hypothetical protein